MSFRLPPGNESIKKRAFNRRASIIASTTSHSPSETPGTLAPKHIVAVLHDAPFTSLISKALFDYGGADVLDQFCNADLIVADVTEKKIRPSLFYQLSIREALGRKDCILTILREEDDRPIRISFHDLKFQTASFKVVDENAFVEAEDSTAVDAELVDMEVYFEHHIKAIVPRLVSQKRLWFLQELRSIRAVGNHEQRREELGKLEGIFQQDPSRVTIEAVYHLLLNYRDIQDYERMIHLVTSLADHPDLRMDSGSAPLSARTSLKKSPLGSSEDESTLIKRPVKIAIRALLAIAHMRRNSGGDIARAIDILQREVVFDERYRSPDNACLVGRLYKNIFDQSRYTDEAALDQAIVWYRQGYQVQQSDYAGINLAVLLVIKGETFKKSAELQQILSCMNLSIGKYGKLDSITNYWIVSTVFEMSILTLDWLQALKAATRMFQICRRTPIQTNNVAVIFEFWRDFFQAACQEGSFQKRDSILVLLLEPEGSHSESDSNIYQPCRLLLNRDVSQIHLHHVVDNEERLASDGTAFKFTVTEWMFNRTKIRGAALHKEDPRVLFFYAGTEDYELVFPSEFTRRLFHEYVQHLVSSDLGLEDCSPHVKQVRYAFELDENDERVMLGRGSFGSVFSALDLDTKKLIAIKEIQIRDSKSIFALQEEINMHKRWKHPHIVQYLGSEVDGNILRIFIEQVPGGSLSDLLRHKWGPLGEHPEIMSDYTRQILKGLAYLHEQDIIHRDIKGDNVLVNQYDGKLKLADFGTSRRLAALHPLLDATSGTPVFMAPEVINASHGYGLAADIWSVGCTVLEMATGLPPFSNYNPHAAMFKVGRDKAHPDIPESMDANATSFMLECFRPEPKDRPTAIELLQHVFILGEERIIFLRSHSEMPEHTSVSKSASTTSVSSDSISVVKTPTRQSMVELTNPGNSVLHRSRKPVIVHRSQTLAHPPSLSLTSDFKSPDLPDVNQEHVQSRSSLIEVMVTEQDGIVDQWMKKASGIVDTDSMASFLTPTLLLRFHVELAKLVEFSSAEEEPTIDEIVEVASSLPTSRVHDIISALSYYKDSVIVVLRKNLKQYSIKPHWMFEQDKILTRMVKLARLALSVLIRKGRGESQEGGLRFSNASPYEDSENATPKSNRVLKRQSVMIMHNNDIDQLEEENARLEGQLRDVTRRLHSALQSLVGERTARLEALSAESSTDMLRPSSNQSNVTDADLALFLAEAGLDKTTAARFGSQGFTLSSLIEFATQEDLQCMLPRIGDRSRLWGKIQQRRQQQKSS